MWINPWGLWWDEVKASDDDVDERLTALRERFGSLVGVERAVEDGDFVSIDLSAAIADEEIDSVTGVSYEVGSKNMLEGMDDALLGMAAGVGKTYRMLLEGHADHVMGLDEVRRFVARFLQTTH